MRQAFLTIVVIVSAGCVSPQVRDRPFPGDGGRQLPTGVATTPGIAMALKVVSAKEEPNTLIASDRSSCRVPEQKYRETALGDKVFCAWSKV